MKTEEEINTKIMRITMVIQENYPELSKFLNEMPITVPIDNNPEVNVRNLEIYYESLVNLFRKYVGEHQLNYINQRTDQGHL